MHEPAADASLGAAGTTTWIAQVTEARRVALETAPPQLFVRGAVGRTLTVNGLRTTDDVAALLAAVEAKVGVPRECAWLCFGGKRLEPGQTLAGRGLIAGSTVHFAVRGRGGGGARILPSQRGGGAPSEAEAVVQAAPAADAPAVAGSAGAATEASSADGTAKAPAASATEPPPASAETEARAAASAVEAPASASKEPPANGSAEAPSEEPCTVVTLSPEMLAALTILDDRLCKALLLGDVALVRVAWLRAQPEDYRLQRRQDLDASEALLAPKDAVALVRKGTRGVGVVSHGWLSAGDPDPAASRVKVLRNALHELPHIEAVFFDFMSLFQKPRDEMQDAAFGRSLGVVSARGPRASTFRSGVGGFPDSSHRAHCPSRCRRSARFLTTPCPATVCSRRWATSTRRRSARPCYRSRRFPRAPRSTTAYSASLV